MIQTVIELENMANFSIRKKMTSYSTRNDDALRLRDTNTSLKQQGSVCKPHFFHSEMTVGLV